MWGKFWEVRQRSAWENLISVFACLLLSRILFVLVHAVFALTIGREETVEDFIEQNDMVRNVS